MVHAILGFDGSGWRVFIKTEIIIATGMVWPVSSDKWTAPLVWLYFKNIMKETTVELEVDDRLWTSNTSPVARLFQNKLMFLLKITLIYEKPLLTTPENTITYHNALYLSPQNFA